MSEMPKKYGRRNVPKMIRQVDLLRQAISAEATPTIQDAWDKIEEHIDYAYRRADLPPTLSAAMELPEVKALVHAVASQLAYMDMCGDHGDLYNRMTAALTLTADKEPKT